MAAALIAEERYKTDDKVAVALAAANAAWSEMLLYKNADEWFNWDRSKYEQLAGVFSKLSSLPVECFSAFATGSDKCDEYHNLFNKITNAISNGLLEEIKDDQQRFQCFPGMCHHMWQAIPKLSELVKKDGYKLNKTLIDLAKKMFAYPALDSEPTERIKTIFYPLSAELEKISNPAPTPMAVGR